eukprot:scaffold2636_cov340-Pavlova_lutheri.AAC.145
MRSRTVVGGDFEEQGSQAIHAVSQQIKLRGWRKQHLFSTLGNEVSTPSELCTIDTKDATVVQRRFRCRSWDAPCLCSCGCPWLRPLLVRGIRRPIVRRTRRLDWRRRLLPIATSFLPLGQLRRVSWPVGPLLPQPVAPGRPLGPSG